MSGVKRAALAFLGLAWVLPNQFSSWFAVECDPQIPGAACSIQGAEYSVFFTLVYLATLLCVFGRSHDSSFTQDALDLMHWWHGFVLKNSRSTTEWFKNLASEIQTSPKESFPVVKINVDPAFTFLVFGFLLLVFIPVCTSWLADGFGQWHAQWYGLKTLFLLTILATIINSFVLGVRKAVRPAQQFDTTVSWGIEKPFINLVLMSMLSNDIKDRYELREFSTEEKDSADLVVGVFDEGAKKYKGIPMQDFVALAIFGKKQFYDKCIGSGLQCISWINNEGPLEYQTIKEMEAIEKFVSAITKPKAWVSITDVAFAMREGGARGAIHFVVPKLDHEGLSLLKPIECITQAMIKHKNPEWTTKWIFSEQCSLSAANQASTVEQVTRLFEQSLAETLKPLDLDDYETVKEVVDKHVEYVEMHDDWHLIINTKAGTKTTALAAAFSSLGSMKAAARVPPEHFKTEKDPFPPDERSLFVEVVLKMPRFL